MHSFTCMCSITCMQSISHIILYYRHAINCKHYLAVARVFNKLDFKVRSFLLTAENITPSDEKEIALGLCHKYKCLNYVQQVKG